MYIYIVYIDTDFLGDDLLYFYMGYNEGGYCNKHIISPNNINNDILLPLRSFARDYGYKSFVLLGSDGKYILLYIIYYITYIHLF